MSMWLVMSGSQQSTLQLSPLRVEAPTAPHQLRTYFPEAWFIPQPSGPIIEVGEVGPEGRKALGKGVWVLARMQ